ncbi:MAG: hypothetical protein Q8L97_06775 [Nitrosomonas sp.]|uniref:hypothetical protein n=1 Tax=Nitrosomonas sp. TaxID=42353 RepID=UPI0027308D70|nr:hypothetical protein [Nitrosomonas sp.]MDP1549849.1 hypothetical protein [Nitrosomonas sp.]
MPSSSVSAPWRVNAFMTRWMIWSSSVCSCSAVGVRTPWNAGVVHSECVSQHPCAGLNAGYFVDCGTQPLP